MQHIKNIFFDNDGILVDTEPLFFEANRQILVANGSHLTLEEHADINMAQGKSVLLKIANNAAELKELTRQRNIIYLDLINNNESDLIIPNVENCLKKLQPHFSMSIVTNSRRDTFEAIHSQTNVLSFMDFVLTRDDVKHSKPNPHAYLKALELAKIKPNEALVIEDSERGVCAAHAAGIQCWAIPNDLTKNQNFSKAERVLESIDEIIENLSAENHDTAFC